MMGAVAKAFQPDTPDRVSSALSFLDASDRDEWVDMAFCTKDALGDAGKDVWMDWSRSAREKFNQADAEAVWKSAKAGGAMKAATLFYRARHEGWCDNSKPIEVDPAELKRREEEHRRQEAEAAAEQEKIHAVAATKAKEIWFAGSPDINGHRYHFIKTCEGKRELSFGKKVRRAAWPQNGWDDALLVPIYGPDSKIMSLEAISPNGDKMALKGGAKSGGIYPLAPFSAHESGVVIVAEGLATAAACMQSTGYPAVVAFCDSNLRKAAEFVKAKRQDARIVVAADIGSEHKASAAAAAVGGVVAIPAGIPRIERGTDFWNVWAVDQGDVLVKHIINAALKAGPVQTYEEPAPEQPAEVDMPGAEAGANQMQEPGAQIPVPPPAGAPKRRTVQVIPSELPAAVDQAEAALVEQCNDIFQRAGIIVRPVRALIDVADGQQVDGVRLSQVNKHHLAERLTGAAHWEKYDARAGDFVPIDCPVKIAETYLARDGAWRLKALAGIIDAPTLRPDGSILDTEGFDEQTGLLLLGDQSAFKPIPENPSKEDAQEALGRLLDLIADFPFVSNQDRSVALSGILTACIRRSLPSAPLHDFSAPTAGSGKSMLVDLASIIACGRQAAVMSQGRDEAEQEKRLASALLAGDQVISCDNATLPIDGDLLCQCLTQQSVRLRVLGASVLRTMPTNAAFFATGNGLLIQGDMTRRALLCSLDPECERPEQRVFAANPKDVAEKNRSTLLCDVLTILRAFHIAGRPQPTGVVPLGSFEVWSQWVRGALLWLEQDDPVQTMEKTRASDPKLEAIVAVMSQWREVVGTVDVSVKDVISKATEPKSRPDADSFSYRPSAPVRHEFSHDDLREALLTVAGTGGAINSRSLGKWLAVNKGRLIALPGKDGEKLGSFRFVQTTARHGVAIWKLEEVKK